ncbi:g3586 [Coccomyxa elongata]
MGCHKQVLDHHKGYNGLPLSPNERYSSYFSSPFETKVLPEKAVMKDYKRLLPEFCMEAALLEGSLTNGSAFDQALFEALQGMAKGLGDESSMPDLHNYNAAGREKPPVSVSSLPNKCSALLESMPPFNSDPAACRVEACSDGSHMQMRDAALDLIGVPSDMRPGAAQTTETLVSVTGPDGFVYTYLPSDVEAAKRMSVDELVASIESMIEDLAKYFEFNAKAGGILAEFMQDYGRLTMESH